MDRAGKIYQPIRSSNSSEDGNKFEDETAVDHEFISALHTSKRRVLYLLYFLIAILVGSNGLWMKNWGSSRSEISPPALSYFDSGAKIMRPFHWDTEFSTDNKSLSNQLWSNLFPAGGGMVSVPTTWARERQLPVSIQDPGNARHSVYFTAVLHQMHCLTVLRASIHRYADGKEQTVSWEHAIHCLDSIRQALICNLDDTLLYSENGNTWGDGQPHVCRDWGAFIDWVELHAKIN